MAMDEFALTGINADWDPEVALKRLRDRALEQAIQEKQNVAPGTPVNLEGLLGGTAQYTKAAPAAAPARGILPPGVRPAPVEPPSRESQLQDMAFAELQDLLRPMPTATLPEEIMAQQGRVGQIGQRLSGIQLVQSLLNPAAKAAAGARPGVSAESQTFDAYVAEYMRANPGASRAQAQLAASNFMTGLRGTRARVEGTGRAIGGYSGPGGEARLGYQQQVPYRQNLGQMQPLPGTGESGAYTVAREKWLAEGMPADTADVLAGFDNVMGVIGQLKSEFSDDQLKQWVGFVNKPYAQIMQITNDDPKVARFLNLTNQLQLMSFDLGGKQLTPMERQVVMAILPIGTEFSYENFKANLQGTQERLTRLRQSRVSTATQTRRDLMRPGEAPQAAPQGPVRVKTPAEAMALPAGTVYIAPDGVTRRR